jgi:hypothetical protein
MCQCCVRAFLFPFPFWKGLGVLGVRGLRVGVWHGTSDEEALFIIIISISIHGSIELVVWHGVA